MATGATKKVGHDEDAEAALLVRLRAGEERAFEEVVRAHGGRMLASIRRILPRREDAEDALQEAFLAAFRSLGGFSGRARLSTWLHRIAINSALMRLRRQRRSRERSLESLLPGFTEHGHFLEPPAPWADPALLYQRDEARAAVHAAIAELPEKQREALMMRDIEGLTNEAVADELGVTVNAAKIRIHRGRQALRELLDPHLREVAT